MVKVLNMDATPVNWQGVTDRNVLDTLCKVAAGRVVTDSVTYEDRYAAYKIVAAYRDALMRRRPSVLLRCRIVSRGKGFQWFGRIETRIAWHGRKVAL